MIQIPEFSLRGLESTLIFTKTADEPLFGLSLTLSDLIFLFLGTIEGCWLKSAIASVSTKS